MKRYSTFDLIVIAMLATLGLGTKQIVRPLISIITIPLLIPGGALAGGFYMLWLVLTKRIVPKLGSGMLFGVVQTLVVIILPFGSHGIFTFVTYPLPGVAVDLVDLIMGKYRTNILNSLLEGVIANVVGTLAVSILIFDMPWNVMLFIILLAVFSGNLGGLLAHLIFNQIKGPLIRESIIISDIVKEKGEPSKVEPVSE